jgi:hypothetical protein
MVNPGAFTLRLSRFRSAEDGHGQPLRFSASSVWGISTRFRLQIRMIPRREHSFDTPHGRNESADKTPIDPAILVLDDAV